VPAVDSVAAKPAAGKSWQISMEKLLSQLVEKLRKAFDARLISVVLYGSAASGEHHPRFSDINVLCVLAEITPRELAACEEIARWWRERANAALMLMTEPEVSESADSFAAEFIDIQRARRLLYGKDVISGLAIGRQFYRAQVERDLRAKLLRLRQKAAGMMSQPDLLRRLLLDSVSSFSALFGHALTLRGVEGPQTRREVIALAREHFQIDAAPFDKLLDVREGRIKPREADPLALLRPYLDGVAAVIARMER
jgi:predicted nucleotidyltransferase